MTDGSSTVQMGITFITPVPGQWNDEAQGNAAAFARFPVKGLLPSWKPFPRPRSSLWSNGQDGQDGQEW